MHQTGTGRRPLTTLPFLVSTLFTITLLSVARAAPGVEDFAQLPTYTDLAISPGGKYLAARVNDDNRYVVRIFAIGASQIERIYSIRETEKTSVGWFRWVTDEHLLASTYSSAGWRSRMPTGETRLITIDVPQRKMISLFHPQRNKRSVQIQDRIVSYLPQEPENILVQYSISNPIKPKVHKINVTKYAGHRRVEYGRHGVQWWMADNEGNVRLGYGLANESVPVMKVRPAGKRRWNDISHRLNAGRNTFTPLAFSSNPNQIYVLSNHESDTDALYLFDIAQDKFVEQLYRHPNVDISSIGIDRLTGELQRIHFVEDSLSTIYVAMRPMDEAVERLRVEYPAFSISLTSLSDDGDHAILLFRAAGDPGHYYLFNRQTGQRLELTAQYPGLEPSLLGKSFATGYTARDGLSIPAFVTLPAGISSIAEAHSVPFIILPHGGPASRDLLRFDYWAQFLVSRGYGVLQMNFRGSDGYGQTFIDAGDRQWGQSMQDDITDGVQWLVDGGYADPNRIAIVGGSYGGYAALMGAIKTPEIYRCAVSFAGVSDLPDLIRQASQYINGRYSTRFIGRLWGDHAMLAENSPARRASDIGIPILLIHGDRDLSVNIEQSIGMARKLDKYDKDFKFVQLEGGDHYLSRYEHRLRFLEESAQFLNKCLSVP